MITSSKPPSEAVVHNGRPVDFSFWPSRDVNGSLAPQTRLFSLDPWAIIRQAVDRECPSPRRPEALACLAQARDFFEVGTGNGIEAARPLALYYSYLNLMKAVCLTRGHLPTFDGAHHGLSAKRHNPTFLLADAYLETKASTASTPQVFAEMASTLANLPIASGRRFDVEQLLPQILSGHRLWVEATGSTERFVVLQDIQFRHDPATRSLWLQLELLAEDLSRFGIGVDEMMQASGLDQTFEHVDGRPDRIRIEQRSVSTYAGADPMAGLDQIVAAVRPQLWMTVTLLPPYRRYYLYLSPPAEQASRLPQLLSMYAATFYFGSITRYRPHQFDELLAGDFGPRIRDFITGQPRQFLYLVASEMARRDVARPSIL